MTRDGKKLQMQINFQKQTLKSCNGSLRYKRKGPKWQTYFMQFCVYVTI